MKKALLTRNSKSFTKWDRAKENNIPTADLRNPGNTAFGTENGAGQERQGLDYERHKGPWAMPRKLDSRLRAMEDPLLQEQPSHHTCFFLIFQHLQLETPNHKHLYTPAHPI